METPSMPEGINQALIRGVLAKAPDSRELASGTVACSFSLTVRVEGAKTTSVPLVWYDPPKRCQSWQAGDEIIAVGAVTRRFYRGGAGLGSNTEVMVSRAELVRHRAKAARVLTSFSEALPQLEPA